MSVRTTCSVCTCRVVLHYRTITRPPLKCCYYSVGRQSTKFVLPVPSWSTLSNPLRPPLLPPLRPLLLSPLPDEASKGTDEDDPKDVAKDEEVTRLSLPPVLPCCCCDCCCCPLATLRWRAWRRSDSCWNCCSSCCVRRFFWFLKNIYFNKKGIKK